MRISDWSADVCSSDLVNARVLHAVTVRLSLRPPQKESLKRLVRALEASPDLLSHERANDSDSLASILSTLKAEFPTLEDFEREFPSLCFALATGVGKTRLMGALIGYLHRAHGINNLDRRSVVYGKGVPVRLNRVGSRIL